MGCLINYTCRKNFAYVMLCKCCRLGLRLGCKLCHDYTLPYHLLWLYMKDREASRFVLLPLLYFVQLILLWVRELIPISILAIYQHQQPIRQPIIEIFIIFILFVVLGRGCRGGSQGQSMDRSVGWSVDPVYSGGLRTWGHCFQVTPFSLQIITGIKLYFIWR